MSTLRVATWNIQAIRGASDERLAAIAAALAAHRPDVVLLQEVSSRADTFDRLAALLAHTGLAYSHFGGRDADRIVRRDRRKRYGNVVASRWPLTPVTWTPAPPWPQLIAAADIEVPGHRVRVVSVHAPNAAGNGWDKVRTLEALRAGLLEKSGPCIVAGDFNEPRTFAPAPLSFRARADGSTDGGWTDRFGETHPRSRWQAAVTGVLGDGAPVALATTLAGVEPQPTHVIRVGEPRFFDHVLVSPPVSVEGLTYDHEVRLCLEPLSDHSIVVASLALPAVASARSDRVGAVDTPYGRIVWRDGPLTDGTRITLERHGEAARDLLLGSLIGHTNGAVLRFLP
ncbi:endonuclease/exonuclease/phosphatase family protein [Demequina sp. SYSU T00192]|uniref:Endonuclease/exonuclease/phosphatase family protein n=1 Tax=Demequina litoralis TaxID=3051660 RepID=A0ABT8G9K2_9MICO|nr:endonuclease/exonuclease/phosphatase family protein [Demequina sp. SYSU T00192]MDN4475803.1 endonuclease/exonuclease/phosphatase family protein [Demequina sp. SYSU T00192]